MVSQSVETPSSDGPTVIRIAEQGDLLITVGTTGDRKKFLVSAANVTAYSQVFKDRFKYARFFGRVSTSNPYEANISELVQDYEAFEKLAVCWNSNNFVDLGLDPEMLERVAAIVEELEAAPQMTAAINYWLTAFIPQCWDSDEDCWHMTVAAYHFDHWKGFYLWSARLFVVHEGSFRGELACGTPVRNGTGSSLKARLAGKYSFLSYSLLINITPLRSKPRNV